MGFRNSIFWARSGFGDQDRGTQARDWGTYATGPGFGLADDYFLFALIITHVLKIIYLQSTRFLTGDFDRLNFFIVSEDDECEWRLCARRRAHGYLSKT